MDELGWTTKEFQQYEKDVATAIRQAGLDPHSVAGRTAVRIASQSRTDGQQGEQSRVVGQFGFLGLVRAIATAIIANPLSVNASGRTS